MPQLYHFVAENFKETLMLGGQSQQHMVAGRLCQYLKPWQLEGLRFLYRHHEKNEACILNDESGLGKVVTVATYLGSILTNDTTKKCLIVVRDEQAIEEWRFHLSVLTHLTVKVIEKTTDINFETVFLVKWCTLKSMSEIDKIHFNHIIVDNRGNMLNNKFCTGILLKHFENKITIIISSSDVTSDIKLLHILLRLCGRLERQYADVKVFENKFQLPQLKEGVNNKLDLEDYFLKREKVISFCREFRLRRYCHQFDEEFPIVSRSEFQQHLEQWKNQNKNSNSSGSVKLLSSSSEKDTEELFREYFQVKHERDNTRLDEEVQRINEEAQLTNMDEDIENISDDLVVMSPLLVVSETESEDEQAQRKNYRNSQFIEEINGTEDEVREETIVSDKKVESKKSRRKSKIPTKTPAKDKTLMEPSKTLRSRTLTSPKKPLPISTKSKKKSLETDNVKAHVGATKQRKDKETEKQFKKQQNPKDQEKTKETPQKQKDSSSTENKDTKDKDNDKSPSSDKTLKDKNSSPINKSVHVKLKPFQSNWNDKQDETKQQGETRKVTDESSKSNQSPKAPKDKSMSKDKPSEIESEKKNNKADVSPPKKSYKTVSAISLMLEEAQKFVRNENIGRKTKDDVRKRRTKALEVPEVTSITKKPETQIEESKTKLNKISKKTKKLTELRPVGVHAASTRGMERQTRSNPKSSKYMKIYIEQVDTEKKKSPMGINRRRGRPCSSSKPEEKDRAKEKLPSPPPQLPPSPSSTSSVISESPAESIQLGQALTPTNGIAVPDFIAPAPRNSDYNFPLMLDKETSDSECQIASPSKNNNEVIVLTGSSTNEREMEPPKSTVSRRKTTAKPPMVTIHRPFFSKAKSPDLFSTCSDLSLPCSQQQSNKSHFEGFKIFGSELRQSTKPRSFLDILDRMLEPRSGIIAAKKTTPPQTTEEMPKTSSHQHCVEDEDAMFEITTNGTFGNTLRINSNGEMSPIHNKNQSTPPPSASGHSINRITNYLISNSQHTSILGQPLPSSVEDVNDLIPKTPKRRKSLSGFVKRSPRSMNNSGSGSGKSQSTKLTEWLVKNSNNSQIISESQPKPHSTKRRRLDLSFTDK